MSNAGREAVTLCEYQSYGFSDHRHARIVPIRLSGLQFCLIRAINFRHDFEVTNPPLRRSEVTYLEIVWDSICSMIPIFSWCPLCPDIEYLYSQPVILKTQNL